MTVTSIGTTTTTTPHGHAATVNETILPRKYQEEIFRRAQEHNIIAALDTDSGKTMKIV
jgi:endoribonuclease Dicer